MDSLTLSLIRRFSSGQSELHIGGKSITAIADTYGTPLYIYDRGPLDKKLNVLRTELPEFEIYYSVRANPNLAILRHFVLSGCGLGVASAGELTHALAAGCPADRLFMSGLGKTDKDLELAASCSVRVINVESTTDAERLAAICTRGSVRARVGVRVNLLTQFRSSSILSGPSSPLGADEEKLASLVEVLNSMPCMDLCGISIYVGTRILDSAALATGYRKGLEIALSVASQIGRPLQMVNFAGGLGIPYYSREPELDLSAFGTAARRLLSVIRERPDFRNTHFSIELGRFLTAEAGIYVTRVVDIRESGGKKLLIVDGGMSPHLSASQTATGNIGNYPMALLQKLNDQSEESVQVSGPLESPWNTLGSSVSLPVASVGDLLGIFQSGAYARSTSLLAFESHDSPPEVWSDEGGLFLIRSRGCAEDFMRDVSVPSHLSVRAARQGNSQ
jgi:diaminopimelate decarboxylase